MAAAQITTGSNITGNFDLEIRGSEAGIASSLTLFKSSDASTTNWKKVETFRTARGGFTVTNVGENSFKVEDTNSSGLTAYYNQA